MGKKKSRQPFGWRKTVEGSREARKGVGYRVPAIPKQESVTFYCVSSERKVKKTPNPLGCGGKRRKNEVARLNGKRREICERGKAWFLGGER